MGGIKEAMTNPKVNAEYEKLITDFTDITKGQMKKVRKHLKKMGKPYDDDAVYKWLDVSWGTTMLTLGVFKMIPPPEGLEEVFKDNFEDILA